jgi:hypothetical protein
MGYIMEYAGEIRCRTRDVQCELLAALMLVLGLLGGQKCYGLGTQEEEIELLRFMADGYEANLDRLRSWKGTAIMRKGIPPVQPLDGRMPLSFKEDTVEQLKFVADRDKDAGLWYGTLAGKKDVGSEGKLRSLPVNSGMNKGEYHYRMNAISEPQLNPRSKRRLLIYSKDAVAHGFENLEFDPLWMLIEDIGAHRTMGDALRMWAETIEKKMPPPEGGGYNIERKGDVVTIKTWQPDNEVGGGATFSSSYVFDISKGCSAVGQHHVSSRSETHWKLDYVEHNGVFVPKEVTYVRRRSPSKGLHHQIVFTTEMVNEPVSESEFSYEALGLRPGDYIVDHTKGGLRYRWREDFSIDEALEGAGQDLAAHGEKKPAQLSKTEIAAPAVKDDAQEAESFAANEEAPVQQWRQRRWKSGMAYWLLFAGILAGTAVGVLFLNRKLKATTGGRGK